MAIICPKCGRQYDVVLFDFQSYILCDCGYKITKEDLHRRFLLTSAVYVIIPARYQSTRFPGKVLVKWQKKPLIQHVYECANKSPLPKAVFIATDDKRIANCVKTFKGNVIMTSSKHPSGTDRLAEAAQLLKLSPTDIIVNVQGDMPYFPPQIIEEVANPLLNNPFLTMATLVCKITDTKEIYDPNCVKVVFSQNGRAIYFSRSPIPYYRDETKTIYYKHIGIYAYRKAFLDKYIKLSQTPLEKAECLEQLRVLEHGYTIYINITEHEVIDINTPEDLKKLEKINF
ncbi:MAG TPA: 3-deoxy-manno-octulosonate cytidylyltransferase [Candidatus Desulfofervidus auxilii]|uniref:3-deoxy-manno-octulosonate cytidylyltransferase n=1 Tax=Desulfofervidus auxilii TaxID=1621989 RepID=A0A7C0U1G9_DESA2|nr:3-deoxy-manno-octulosonate cytidylyltransferase [Candidatus Desulfofervidus auxilii]